MKFFFDRIIPWLDDRMHPVAVRDMRRSVQNRLVYFGLLIIIIGVVGICLIGIASNDHHSNQSYSRIGRDLFSIIYYSTGAVMILLIPMYLCLRVGDDLCDRNNLVEISTLKPLGRTWGFFTVGFILMGLIAAIALPYLMFCYMLGGLDLPTIFLKWLAMFILALPAMMGGIFMGTITANKHLRIIFNLLYAGGLLWLYVILADEWLDRIRVTRTHSEEWIITSTFSFFLFAWFYLLATARLSSSVSNRVLPLRIFASASFVILYAIGIIHTYVEKDLNGIMIWFSISLVSLTLMFIIALCEREEPGQRVRGSIPRRWWVRLLAWPFYSGSAGGLLWCVVTAALLILGFALGWKLYFSLVMPSFGDKKEFSEITITIAYFIICAYAYGITAIAARRILLRSRISNEQTPLIFVLIFLAVFMVSGFLVFLNAPAGRMYFGEAKIQESPWLAINPVNLCFVRTHHRDIFFFFKTGAMILGGWSFVITLIMLPWFIWQFKEFKPLDDLQVKQDNS